MPHNLAMLTAALTGGGGAQQCCGCCPSGAGGASGATYGNQPAVGPVGAPPMTGTPFGGPPQIVTPPIGTGPVNVPPGVPVGNYPYSYPYGTPPQIAPVPQLFLAPLLLLAGAACKACWDDLCNHCRLIIQSWKVAPHESVSIHSPICQHLSTKDATARLYRNTVVLSTQHMRASQYQLFLVPQLRE